MKKISIISSVLICTLLCACAQPNSINLKEETGDVQSAKTTAVHSASISVGNKMSKIVGRTDNVSASVPSGDEISICETIGEGDYAFTVDAVVHVPDSVPQQGTFVTKNIDISVIEQYLCNGESLHEDPSPTDPSVVQYISDGNQVDNALSFDMQYAVHTTSPGTASFSNFRLDEAYTSPAMKILTSDKQSAQQQEFVTEMEDSAATLLDQLSVEGILNSTWLNTDGTKKHCFVNFISCLNGYPLLADTGNFCLTSVNIGEQGTNGINFQGLFEISEASDVQVLSINEIMDKVRESISEKKVSIYQKTVTNIDLAYLTVSGNDKTVNFYPVWVFSGSIEEITGLVPFLCVDARTGEIVSMK